MADERLLITIEGKDGASKTFVAVGKSAETAGKSVEASGKTGGKAMRELAEETERAGKSAEDMSRKYAAAGAAIGTGLTVISKLGASYREQRLELQSLEDQYGSSADAVIDFTEAIQDSFNQSNDAARDSALTFATLYRNYEMGEQQIMDLMQRTADISAARGRNMTETSQMIQNALRGEAEYIEQIGVTLNDTYVASQYAARGLGNWNTLTDEAARAQFRYVLLMEQTADTQGRAAEEADRAGGLMRRWINEAQDAGQTVGGLLGPLGEMGAEFSQIAIGLPVVAAGFGSLIGKVQGSARAMALLGVATGPVGIAITGAAIGIGLLTSAFVSHQRESAEAAEIISTLTDAYLDLKVAADEAGRVGDVSAQARIDQLRFQVESARAEGDAIVQEAANNNMRIDLYRELQDAQTRSAEEADAVAAAQRILSDAMTDQSINAKALAADLDTWYWQMMRGEITLDEYDERVVNASLNLDQYRISVDDATAAQQLLNTALADGAISAQDMGLMARVAVLGIDEITEASRRSTRNANESNRERRKTFDLWVQELDYVGKIGFASRQYLGLQLDLNSVTEESNRGRRRTADLIREEATATQLLGMDTLDLANATQDAAEARDRLINSAGGLGASAFQEASRAAEEYSAHLETVADNMERLLEVSGFGGLGDAATEMRMFAMETERAGDSLDTIYRVAVENTSAIAQQSQGIADWADELIGAQGEYSKLDELVQAGRISGTSGIFTGDSEYAQAQRAYNDLQRENAEIQEHILTIQAKQAPLIRDQMVDYENYLQLIADMPAEQQLITLGWMDSASAARAMEFQTLAVAAATGQLGENGEEVFTSMITGAAQADPVLKALLIDMGLISEGADGTITVNFDGVEDGRSAIGALNETIGILIDLLDDDEINGSFSIDATDDASPVIRTARQNLADADGDSATMSIHLNDYATAGINAASWALSALDGTVATSTVRTVYESRGLGPGMAQGGVIGYAGGGVITELAEAGGEVVHFASGGTAYVGARGFYELSAGDFVQPHNAVSNYGGLTIDFSGAVFNNTSRDEMNAWAREDLMPAIERATQDLKTGMGAA